MGKLTQAWQADDGQFFGTKEEMLAHEQAVYVQNLEKNWDTRAILYPFPKITACGLNTGAGPCRSIT